MFSSMFKQVSLAYLQGNLIFRNQEYNIFRSQKRTSSNAVWPDLAHFWHFGTTLKVLGKFLSDYLVFGKILILLWQKCFNIW